jgi:ferritin-like metal-binding protein YciE
LLANQRHLNQQTRVPTGEPDMKSNPLAQLLEDELQDLYDAEKQLTKALPKLAKKACAPELKEAIEHHLQETEGQIDRLEQAFELLELPIRGKKCKGMANLLKEGQDMISEAEDDDAVDAVMIGSAQKVEHYEIAGYGTARTWARVLGHEDVATLLEESLDEEKIADQKLTDIAESFVNMAAANEDEAASGSQRRESGRRVRSQAADRRRTKTKR